jgi:hypothetical protein
VEKTRLFIIMISLLEGWMGIVCEFAAHFTGNYGHYRLSCVLGIEAVIDNVSPVRLASDSVQINRGKAMPLRGKSTRIVQSAKRLSGPVGDESDLMSPGRCDFDGGSRLRQHS